MKLKIETIVIIFVLSFLFCTSSIAQDAVLNSQKIKPNKIQMALLVSYNSTSNKNNLEDASPKSYTKQFDNVTPSAKFNIEYFFTPKIGAGFAISGIKYNYKTYHVVEDYFPGGFGPLNIYFPPENVYIYDAIEITTKGTVYDGYVIFRLLPYNSTKKVGLEITSRAGLSVVPINENQTFQITDKVTYPNSTWVDYHGSYRTYSFHKTALNGFLNAQLALHTGKHFSIILADLTGRIGIVNPEIPTTSMTSVYGKKVTMQSHKINTTSFSYAFGIALYF